MKSESGIESNTLEKQNAALKHSTDFALKMVIR